MDIRHDIHSAVRSLRRYPVASLVATASLAAGIGATTATLTVRNAVFHKPPPAYRDPAQISRILTGTPDRPIRPLGSPVPAGLYAIWRDTLGQRVAASTSAGEVREIRTSTRTASVPHRAITPGLFAVLGVEPALGSGTLAAGGDARPAVLSYRVWRQVFDGQADAIGQTVWIDEIAHTVVAVMPERFWLSDMSSPIWTLLDPRNLASNDPLDVVVRRVDGRSPESLAAELQIGLNAYVQRLPAGERQLQLKVSGVEGTPLGHSVAIVLPYVLGMSVVLTLLIACANVATLMIAQWTAREHEIAIRASLGASRGRIIRSLLTESVLVSMMGATLGVCATFALRGWILRRGGDLTFFDVSIDARILLQTATIAVVTGIVAGLAPAVYETRRLQTNPLRAIAGADVVRQRWRHALVVFEIAVTSALLVVTSAMIDGYYRARRADMGFETRPLMTARIENPGGVPTTEILQLLNRLPGVAASAASTTVPFAATGPRERIAVDARGTSAVVAERGNVTPAFFDVLGVPLGAGRAFSKTDTPASRTAIVSDGLQRHLFQGRRAVGENVWIDQTSYEIVGVVADYSSNPLRAASGQHKLYLPLVEDSKEVRRQDFLIRARSDPASLVQTVRREVREAGAGTVTRADTLDQTIRIIGQEILFGTSPLFPLIAIGLLLTTAGIYGVLAFALTRRARELAIRVAVGASGRDLVRLISAQTLRLVLLGLMLGTALTFGLARLVRAGGGAGSIFDPGLAAFAVPIAIVIFIGLIATWLPARRASKIDPVVLLRTI
jgi:putative ABC transport system permease protein